MKKQRNLRSKQLDEDVEGETAAEIESSKMSEVKLLQKMRKRGGGMDAESLAAPAPSSSFHASAVEAANERSNEPAESIAMLRDMVKETVVHSKEADEDEHMKRFVEIELAKRLGKKNTGPELDENEKRRRKIDEDLYSIPEAFQPKPHVENVEGGATMTGIAEVSVPMSERLKRIEETEAAKRRMLAAASTRGGLDLPKEDWAVKKEVKMKRNECPVSFGKVEPKRHKEREEVEKLRKRVIRD